VRAEARVGAESGTEVQAAHCLFAVENEAGVAQWRAENLEFWFAPHTQSAVNPLRLEDIERMGTARSPRISGGLSGALFRAMHDLNADCPFQSKCWKPLTEARQPQTALGVPARSRQHLPPPQRTSQASRWI
jgi:hypothetical protein